MLGFSSLSELPLSTLDDLGTLVSRVSMGLGIKSSGPTITSKATTTTIGSKQAKATISIKSASVQVKGD